MELGTVYQKLGAQVTFVEALPQILTGVDPEAVRLVQKGVRQRGGDGPREREGQGLRAPRRRARGQGRGGRQGAGDPGDKILVAVGFRPNSEGLGLEEVGVKLGPKGFTELNEQYQTSVPSIFAVGDLAGPPSSRTRRPRRARSRPR